MKVGLFIAFFLFSSVKFLIAPPFGFEAGFNLFETMGIMFSGGVFGVLFFFKASHYFMERARLKKLEKINKLRSLGGEDLPKFYTKKAKRIVKLKRKLGLYGVVFIALPFASLPIEGIICAKFFKHEKRIVPLLIISVAIWTVLLTLFFDLVYDRILSLL